MQARGDVSEIERAYARQKVGHLRGVVEGPVLFARVDLTAHADPARERRAFAKAEIDVNGRCARAHVAASTMLEAIDLLEARLRSRLERVARHEADKHLRHRGDVAWRHGDEPTTRRPSYPRPPEDREIVRHKTFAIGEMTPEEAADDLELLDHDFYLFQNVETGEDNVIARSPERGFDLFEPSATCSLADIAIPLTHSANRPTPRTTEEAVTLLDLTDEPFIFFLDPDSGRGRVATTATTGSSTRRTKRDEHVRVCPSSHLGRGVRDASGTPDAHHGVRRATAHW